MKNYIITPLISNTTNSQQHQIKATCPLTHTNVAACAHHHPAPPKHHRTLRSTYCTRTTTAHAHPSLSLTTKYKLTNLANISPCILLLWEEVDDRNERDESILLPFKNPSKTLPRSSTAALKNQNSSQCSLKNNPNTVCMYVYISSLVS